jgi:hypothetical protein
MRAANRGARCKPAAFSQHFSSDHVAEYQRAKQVIANIRERKIEEGKEKE